jgi:hypothetical protein
MTDFGVTIVWGALTTTGVLDMPSEVIAGGMVITTDYSLMYVTSTMPGLAYNDSITVEGAAYTVREVRMQDDGKFSIAYLSKV